MGCKSSFQLEGQAAFIVAVSLGQPEAYTAEAPSEVCPVVRLNLRVRDGGEGFKVRWEQRVSQVDVNPVYYVFDHSWLRCDDAFAHEQLRVSQELSCY